jgi:uncharacterized protein (DUF697 family)
MAQATTASDDAEVVSPNAAAEPRRTTDAERDAAASKLVDRYALWSGAAGLIPLPIADIAAVSGVQLQMLRRLSQVYDVPFSDNLGKSLIASLAGSIIPASTAVGIVSTVKGVPAIGTTIGVITMPAISAGATYLIGRVFIQHFASGGTLLDFNPPDYREFIKAQKEKLGASFSARPAAPEPSSSPSPHKSAPRGSD